MITPGSVGDWMQMLVMGSAIAGLAATCGRALREEDAPTLVARKHVQAIPAQPVSGNAREVG